MEWGFRRADQLCPGVVASAVGYATADIEQSIHRGLPSPYLTFIVTLDQPVVGAFTRAAALGPDAISTTVTAAGLHTEPAYIRQPPVQTGIQLALYPPAARVVLGVPAGELSGLMVDAGAVVGKEIGEVREKMIEADGWSTRFALLQEHLRCRTELSPRSQLRPEVAEAWRWLVRHRGAGSVAGLARHVQLSQRQLHTLFHREFGLGPKAFNRLLRFQHSVRMITERVAVTRELDLAAIAADCGFADQSHLNREFRALVGTSPTDWVREEVGNIRSGGHRNGDSD